MKDRAWYILCVVKPGLQEYVFFFLDIDTCLGYSSVHFFFIWTHSWTAFISGIENIEILFTNMYPLTYPFQWICLLYVCACMHTLECAYREACIAVRGQLKSVFSSAMWGLGIKFRSGLAVGTFPHWAISLAQAVLVKMDTFFFTKWKQKILVPDCKRQHAHMGFGCPLHWWEWYYLGN